MSVTLIDSNSRIVSLRKRRYSGAMRIIQISDSHISQDHPTRTAELERCVEQINAAERQPDIVVHTGDVAHNGLTQEYAIARGVLERLSAPYIVLAGNRDNRKELIRMFDGVGHHRFASGFVQYAVEVFDTRLICVDTVSERSNKGELCPARFTQIEEMLAADPSKSAVLFLHHPPFEVSVAPDGFQFEDWAQAEAMQALMQRHHHVRALYCGHVHREARVTVGQLPAHVATCIASDLRWDTVNSCIYEHMVPPLAQSADGRLTDSVS